MAIFPFLLHSLMCECYTYTQWSICVAPASGTVWFVPVLSSDTGTWLWLHWFAAGGAPADEAWHWHTPPPDTERGRERWQTDVDFIHLYLYKGVCCETYGARFQQQPAYHSHCYIYSHLIDCQCDRSRVLPDTELLHWSCWGLSGFLKDAAGKIYISCFSLPPSFTKLTMLPPLNT